MNCYKSTKQQREIQKLKKSNHKMYSTTNRSGILCKEHPNEQYTNYCPSINCLKPLCPDCVQIHTKLHDKQEIESWKHCLQRQRQIVVSTLNTLRKIEDDQKRIMPYKSLQQVIEENVKILHIMKEKMHKIVDEFFNNHQQHIRSLIKKNYRVDLPDITKLRQAIQQMVKLAQKLEGSGKSVLEGLKTSLQLDHQSLLKFFEELNLKERKPVNQTFMIENHELYSKVRSCLQGTLTLNKMKQNSYPNSKYQAQTPFKKSESYSLDQGNLFEPLKITLNNFFLQQSPFNYLHFFIPSSNQLKILSVQSAEKRDFNWKSLLFNGKKELPCYFKSIITPEGDIYLTGGSENDSRSNEIHQYNYERNSLDLVGKMKYERSSHSICYANGLIYMIGGFSNVQNDVTRSCEVFNPKTRKCTQISPLVAPSANSCAVSFNRQYIFKIGGVQNKTQGNNLIQMYSIKKDKWIVVKIEYDRNEDRMELLSFSAGVQINENEILIFGGYDNSETEQPKGVCFSLMVNPQKGVVRVRNHRIRLPFEQGFWNNNPTVHNSKIYALQNINDPQDELTAIADQKRVLIFDGDRWIS